MNCEEVNLVIEEFHDGLLESDLQTQIEKHLANCLSCQLTVAQFEAVKKLLKKTSIPAPSPNLSQGLMEAFQAQHQQSAKSLVWWQKIFAGSVSIPKPILAGALFLMAFSIIGANLIGRNSSISNNSLPEAAKSSTSNLSSESSEQTKIVEVPVIKYIEVPIVKNNVVERVIYVNKPLTRKSNRQRNSVSTKNISNNSLTQSNNFTQTSLKGFQPLSEIKTKIIKEEKLTYEK